ncbi:MAG: protein tyrosine phosphatase family protein [Arenicella sp.]
MPVNEILNYVEVNERLSLAGQPSDEQVESLAKEGFEVNVNIAPIDPRYSLDDEPGLSQQYGMEYIHLPVDFKNPTEDNLHDFFAIMDQQKDKKVFVHCAANYRVSAFCSLYAISKGEMDLDQANDFIQNVWNPSEFPPWPEFIEGMGEKLLERV